MSGQLPLELAEWEICRRRAVVFDQRAQGIQEHSTIASLAERSRRIAQRGVLLFVGGLSQSVAQQSQSSPRLFQFLARRVDGAVVGLIGSQTPQCGSDAA